MAMEGLKFVELPTMVLDKLVDHLDYGTRRTCRLVCQKMKEHIDDIGISIKIDSRDPGSADLCKNINATEANLIFLKENQLKLDSKYLEKWMTAILSGPIDTTWIMNSLFRECTNLRVLIIRGDCLTSQDFPEPSELLPVFQHLTTLDVSLSSTVLSNAVDRVSQILKRRPTLKSYKNMDLRVQKNMACLLNNIRSRVLKVFHGFIMANISQRDEERKVRWEHKPLFEFLERHSMTLEIVVVPGLFSGEVPPPYQVYQLPKKIKLFSFSFGISQTIFRYWKDLLLIQDSLQKLTMHDVPGAQALTLVLSTVTNNAHTLTSIQLSFNWATGTISSLDMKTFEFCTLLEVLSIEGCSQKPIMAIKNLNRLPHTRLKSLKLTSVEIGPDFDGVKFMTVKGFKPTALTLVDVPPAGFFRDRKHLLKFMELILRCRTLDTFGLMMGFMTTSLPKWKLFTTAELNEFGLDVWIANLRAEEPPNHYCVRIDFSDMRDIPPAYLRKYGASPPPNDLPYLEAERAVNLDFMELTSRYELAEFREQPYLIPRNADSYTIWINQQTKVYKIQPNTLPYSKRVHDMKGRIRVITNFVMDGTDGNTTFRPLDVEALACPGMSSYKIVDGVLKLK